MKGIEPSTHFSAFDGNGNVAALVNAANGTVSANYEYDPFGQIIRATGMMAKANPFRFSTKYRDDESGLNYYGYRFYNPNTGRWPSKDPMEEKGGMNLYEFIYNNGINSIDFLGELKFKFKVIVGIPVGYAGKWTQPFFAGSGSYTIGSGFAESTVDLTNPKSPWWYPGEGDYCNTVQVLGSIGDKGDSGSIEVYAKDDCGGKFHIEGNYGGFFYMEGSIGGEIARLYSATGEILSTVTVNRNNTFRVASISFSEDVYLSPKKEKLIARYELTMGIPKHTDPMVHVHAGAGISINQ